MPLRLILVVILLVAVSIAIAFVIRTRQRKPEYVIGSELAGARKHEGERLKQSDLALSPIPPEDFPSPHRSFGLLNPQPVALDQKLRELCRTYRQLDAAQRERFRASISMDEFYRLLEFAKRMAVFALRSNDASMVADAFAALAMIDVKRVDYRDLIVAASMLRWAATQLGRHATKELAEAIPLADRETQEYLAAVQKRAAHGDELLESMGYRAVETKFGRGFVQLGHRNYAPTRDLLSVALEVADVADSDIYSAGTIEIATELPDVWLKNSDDASLQGALQEVVGGVTINARLDSSEHPKPEAQHFVIFLVETQSAQAANQLATIAAAHRANWHVTTAACSENLFCLVVARSFMDGVEALETPESIRRFGPKIQKALEAVTQP